MRTDADYAAQVMQRLEALGQVTDEPGRLTRVFASPAMRRANDLVAGWMREAGMSVREDAAGNIIGRHPAGRPGAKTFLLGSHLDTVRDAGRFDGPLGVLVAIACIQQLRDAGRPLPFAVEAIGFADEEGVRFQSACLGSRALTGRLSAADLARTDADGVTMAEALRRFGGNPDELDLARREPQALLGYAEVHIEQGPALELAGQAVGVVTGINGQSRVEVIFTGRAAHAGTTPLGSRQDALTAAARFVLAVETLARRQPGLFATVGQLEVRPGASNVIPGHTRLTVDVRHADDSVREAAVEMLAAEAGNIAHQRLLEVQSQVVQSARSIQCSTELTALLKHACAAHVSNVLELPSGAGHDAAMLAEITPVTMLFVRCKGGVSHHPDESVGTDDVAVALAVLRDFLRLVCWS
jgi:allantoate deiminase